METRNCQNCKKSFDIEPDDFSFYEKMKVPAPGVCPGCRFKMKALFRNETTLYSGRNCDFCGKGIITMYNPKSPYKVYCHDCFYSDKWDPKDYAINYDPGKPFIDQLGELLEKVPKINTYITTGDGINVNSEYVNMASGCKNSYLVFNTSVAEDLMYSRGIRDGRDSADIYFGTSFESCYESINIQQSSGVIWGQNVVGCVSSAFLLNCSGLTNCFGCVNLRNKSHCWFNEQLSAEEYNIRINEVLGSHMKMEEMQQKFTDFCSQFPRRENNNIKTVGSTGDYLFECKNIRNSFEVTKGEDSRHIYFSKGLRDSLGTIGYGTASEQLLECVATGHSSRIIGSYGPENCQDVLYGFYIKNCQNVIGCDALKNSKYSILNKEYSKEEYENHRAHIIEELKSFGLYGLIIPPALAPFAYNESIAQDNFPMTKEEVLGLGFRWEDDIQITKGKETFLPEQIPDHIDEVSDEITKEVLRCAKCERNYKITEQELLFYRKMKLPIPHNCFYCRHQNRILRRGEIKFSVRNCSNCDKEISSNLNKEESPIVYCESCYQQEVV